ncbi:hypothetical protein IM538_13815 [Cytobacillus suaedae]|nr:hypothetical protein IM538_13815 [Cytobacillus suaedae]
MKKAIFLFVMILVTVLVGCGNKYFHFSGESDSWKGEYSANIDGTREDGEFVFGFKNANKDSTFKNLVIVINEGETEQRSDNHKGATVKISSSCSGCTVTSENEQIKVTIKWDDENEETFFLKQDK